MGAIEPAPQSRREPIFSIPAAVVVLAALLILIFAAFDWARPAVQDATIRDLAFSPGRLTVWLWPGRAIDLLVRANTDPAALEQVRAMRELRALSGGPKPWTLVTYALLHGSWTHVLLNTIWLSAFGPPVARRFGAVRFFLFMVVGSIAGALAQWAATPMDFARLIGASAAVSGLMGAATRFVFQPGAPLGAGRQARRPEAETLPASTLAGVFVEARPRVFLAVWFVTNFIFGAFARTLGLSDMPVAWVAHLGGFLAGLVLFPLFDQGLREGVRPFDIGDR